MKRILSVLLALSLIATALAGCASTGGTASTSSSVTSAASSAETSASVDSSASSATSAGASDTAAAETSDTAAESDTITITDQGGVEVTLPKQIDRIAVVGLWPIVPVLSVFFNSADKIVGVPAASMTASENSLLSTLYPELLNASTSFMQGTEINIEELLKLKPDVVFYNTAVAANGEKLRGAGLNAVGMSVNAWDYNCIETLNKWMELFGEIFPENDKAAAVREYSDKMYNLVQERVKNLTDEERARVFFLFQYTDTNILSSGKHFFGQWWADAIGAINVAQDIETDNSIQVNMEQIYAWDPDVVLVTNFTTAQPDDIYNNTVGSYDWSAVKAVEDKRVYKMPLGFYRSYTPGADTPITLLWMAKTVYPELFKDIDVESEARDYYKTVFGIELTDEQIHSIFNPSSEAGKVN